MAYTKHTWQCGEKITTEQLNRIEDGIDAALGGGNLRVVTITEDSGSYSADLTCEEMREIVVSGGYLVARYGEIYLPLTGVDPDIFSGNTRNGLLKALVIPTFTFAYNAERVGYNERIFINVYADNCEIVVNIIKYPHGLAILRSGEGTCDGTQYDTYNVSYNDLATAVDNMASLFYETAYEEESRETVMAVKLGQTEEPDGNTLYGATIYLHNREVHLYSIDPDEPMRDYDCWYQPT